VARSERTLALGALLVLGCEALIGADFGSYGVRSDGGEASGATSGEGGAEGGSGPSAGASGIGGASGAAGTTGGGATGGGGTSGGGATGGGATGGGAGSGGSLGGEGGMPPLDPTSCAGAPSSRDGIDDCGPAGDENCCTSIAVPGGTYNRRHATDDWEATVSAFRYDRYEVTIGRFRTFVSALDAGYRPDAGSGKHAHLPLGGLDAGGGLVEPGWVEAWNDFLIPANGWDEALGCHPFGEHYTPAPGPNENKPVLCVNFYQAYAFCIWDGGFLPTAAEANFVVAGGDEQRLYPWSTESDPPDPDPSYAVYGCLADGAAGCSGADLPAVGSRSPKGDGRWGHADLSGSTQEWGLDSSQVTPTLPCVDCVFIASVASKWAPGANWSDADFVDLSSRMYGGYQADAAVEFVGFRCARVPLDEGP
jgi:formylglycine-generating enzyme required for sulfatase activity